MRQLSLALIIALAACGGSDESGDPPAIDAGPSGPDAFEDCGDGLVSGSEQCDDDNDSDEDDCLSNCRLACGDGIVNASELCDLGIPTGDPGACPTGCDDSDACTSDALSGDSCQTMCINTTIAAFDDDDGCCPVGGDNTIDNDCAVSCGNGVVENGESCDTSIAAGAGACPVQADCVDGISCTEDNLANAGTCTAVCQNPAITQAANDDGCCPSGETVATDNDCLPGCGDGVVTPPETCDTAIANSCPVQADCVDNDVCTQDLLISSGTCQANCQNPVITTPDGGVDGCCPASGNNNNDSDCPVECGNSAVETTETCDDGNTDPGDGCDENCQVEIGPTAYRIDSLLLRDPHAFTQVFFFCPDITGQLNDEFAAAITTDDDGDNLLDLSIVQVFRPLDQSAASTPAEAHFPDCTAPMSSTSCTSTGNGISLTATNQSSGTCLSPLANTTGGYSPAITNSTSPCFADNATDLDIDVGGLIITLRSARVAATYVGNPAGTLVNGLIAGFLTETDADNTFIPDDIAVVGGEPLSSVLPGGAGNCSSNDDRDTGPGGESGWWIYLNFQATQVPWTD